MRGAGASAVGSADGSFVVAVVKRRAEYSEMIEKEKEKNTRKT